MEGNVIWDGMGLMDSSFSDIRCDFSTFVTCDEILGCLVCSITHLPFCWVQILNCVELGNKLWPRAVLGGGLGGTEGPYKI